MKNSEGLIFSQSPSKVKVNSSVTNFELRNFFDTFHIKVSTKGLNNNITTRLLSVCKKKLDKNMLSYTFLSRYRIVASTSPSRFEAHVGLFRLLMKGIFDTYVL